VISFDLDKDQMSYVRATHKNMKDQSDEDANFIEFYNSEKHAPEKLQAIFKKGLAFIDNKGVSSNQKQKIKENLAKINLIPYYELKRKKTALNFQNKIGYFLKDDGSGLIKWANENQLLTSNWAEMISDENHTIFKQNLITRLMMIMFFENTHFLTVWRLSDEDLAKTMLFYESVMAKAQEILTNNDTPELQESFNKLIAIVSTLAGRMVTSFYSQKNYPLFNDLFRPKFGMEDFLLVGVSLNEHLEMRKTWRSKRMDYYSVTSMEQVFGQFPDLEAVEKIQEGLEEQEKQAKAAFLNIFDTLFEAMTEKISDLGNIKVEEQTEFIKFFEDEELKSKINVPNIYREALDLKNNYDANPFTTEFDVSDKENLIDAIDGSNFMVFVRDFAKTMYIPFSMEVFEDRVIRKLSDFPVISAMRLNFSDDDDGRDALEVFREMLYTIGVLRYKPTTYDSKLKPGVKRSIFSWEDKRRMLLI
jgi:hypothetical protein